MENKSLEFFVTSWEKSFTLDEVAKRLNLSLEKCRNRAASYRRRGVNLKRMPRHKSPINVNYLNGIISDIRKKQASARTH